MELSLVRLPLGKETRLPLVMCPRCRRSRVIELRVKTDLNYGRVFFKCLLNIELVSWVACLHKIALTHDFDVCILVGCVCRCLAGVASMSDRRIT
jgi:hypothetical protein